MAQAQFTGQTYGQATQQQQAQQAMPTGPAPTDVQAQQPAPAGPRPGSINLTGPTQRPNEPITAGADFGPGPSSVGAGITPRFVRTDDVLETLRALYALYPNDGLAEMLSKYGNQGY